MKVAVIVQKFPAISETFILNQITGLIDLGHKVDIFSFSRSNDKKVHCDVIKYNLLRNTAFFNELPQDKAGRIIRTAKIILRYLIFSPKEIIKCLNYKRYGGRYYALNNLFKLAPFLRKKYDLIHCHFGPAGRNWLFLKDIFPKTKFIVSFHGYDVNSYPKETHRNVYANLFSRGDIFTANTNFTKRQLIGLGCDARKIIKLHEGIKIKEFTFSERKADESSPVKILSLGRLVEKKGYEYAIKAIAKVLYNHKNIVYIIAGDGPLRNELEKLVRDLNIQNHIRFLGPVEQEEALKLYQDAHIFVLASITASNGDREGQGLVLQEAQASGLPVISTLHNGIPEGVLDGKSAFLVPEKDINALAERIEYLIEHPEIWPGMGREGRKFVEENFDIKKLNQKLMNVYRGVIKNGC